MLKKKQRSHRVYFGWLKIKLWKNKFEYEIKKESNFVSRKSVTHFSILLRKKIHFWLLFFDMEKKNPVRIALFFYRKAPMRTPGVIKFLKNCPMGRPRLVLPKSNLSVPGLEYNYPGFSHWIVVLGTFLSLRKLKTKQRVSLCY